MKRLLAVILAAALAAAPGPSFAASIARVPTGSLSPVSGAPSLSGALSPSPAAAGLLGLAPGLKAPSLAAPALNPSAAPAPVPAAAPAVTGLSLSPALSAAVPSDEPGEPFRGGASDDSGAEPRLKALFDGAAAKPPATAKGDVVDDYFGTKIADPYRALEDPDSEETKAWVDAQNRYSSSYLSAIPGRDRIRERLAELYNYQRSGMPERQGKYWIFSANTGLQNQAVLYKSKRLYGRPEVLLDPNTFSKDGTAALSAKSFSRDGKLLAYAVSRKGSDWQEWRVLDVETGQERPETIRWAKNSSVSWDSKGTGFYYTRFAEPKPGQDYSGINRDQKLYFHKVGTAQDADQLVYERPDHPDWSFWAGEDGGRLLIYQFEGTEPKNRIFIKDLKDPKAPVKPLFGDFDASYSVVKQQGNRLFVQTTKDAPRGRLVVVDLKQPKGPWKEIIPQGKGVLESVLPVGNRFVASWSRDAHQTLEVFGPRGGFQRELKLPGLGSIEALTRTDKKKGFFQFSSFTQPRTVYRVDFTTGKNRAHKRPKTAFNPKKFEVKQVFYPSKDGTKIPMFLVFKKGLKLDGQNPTYLYGYGGFSISLTPGFSPSELAWMEMGGVYAVANLRGGAEYGEAWHDAGRLKNKQNVFDDFIAAAEWLIAEKYTSTPKLAIGGGSNGGLLVGAVMTQRPDLFAAAVPQVGVLDMLRFHLFTVGKGWRSDYGSSQTKEGFETLIKYSPLHNVRPGTAYPATLVMTGDHDDRVVPAHSHKFTAALQAAQAGSAPIMTRIEKDAGHGAGKPMSKYIEGAADMWAFLKKILNIS